MEAALAAVENKDVVLIPKVEYERLLRAQEIQDLLRANGVDNWEGYSLPGDDDFGDED